MTYFAGEYIYHPVHGVGVIQKVTDGPSPEVEIGFRDNTTRKFTVFLLERSGQPISPDGFRAIAFEDPSGSTGMLIDQPVDVIIHALRDFPENKAKTEDLKEYLYPYIPDWETWWAKVQPQLKEDPRIDASQSKLREYGLASELRSQAEDAYLSYKFARQNSAEPPMLAEIARSALVISQKNGSLTREHHDELLEFLKNIIYFERYDLALRMGTLFRLKEDQLIEKDEADELLFKLLDRDIRLYTMEGYTAKRIVDELLKGPIGDRQIDILATGMCTGESLTRLLTNWVIRKSNPEFIIRFIHVALTENLPPSLSEKNYPSLATRLESCIQLLKSLPIENIQWPGMMSDYRTLVNSLAEAPVLDEIRFLLPPTLQLGFELNRRFPETPTSDFPTADAILTAPSLPIMFILAVMDTATKKKMPEFSRLLEKKLLENPSVRQDDFFEIFSRSREGSIKARVEDIINLIHQYESHYLAERGGYKICELARQAQDDELIDLLPSLNNLRETENGMPWKTSLENLREKAYLALLQDQSTAVKPDEALVNAANKLVDLQLESIRDEISGLKNQIKSLTDQKTSFQILLDEKETIVRELRGNIGGNTIEARFEERIRILKDLVTTIAEFEGFLASQTNPSREVEAVITRISSILATYQVTPSEPVGVQLPFNPQTQRLTSSDSISPGEKVMILERGYLIRDHSNKLRLLKPTLVRKI